MRLVVRSSLVHGVSLVVSSSLVSGVRLVVRSSLVSGVRLVVRRSLVSGVSLVDIGRYILLGRVLVVRFIRGGNWSTGENHRAATSH